MLYIDPRDAELVTGSRELRMAWAARKDLRMEHFRIQKKLEEWDTFINTLIDLSSPPGKTEGTK